MPSSLSKYPQARPNSVFPHGYDSTMLTHIMEERASVDDLMRPEYWTSVVPRIQSADPMRNPLILCKNPELTIVEILFVERTAANEVYVRRMLSASDGERSKPVASRPAPEIDEQPVSYKVRWNVNRRGYEVLRLPDKKVVADGRVFPKKELAEAHIKSQYAQAA